MLKLITVCVWSLLPVYLKLIVYSNVYFQITEFGVMPIFPLCFYFFCI